MSRPLVLPPGKPSERELQFRDFERILKLVSRLGSSSEHEVFQAVKQLTRAMQAVDLSWSDIAESIRKVGIGDVKPSKRPKSWAEMDTAERLSWMESLKKAPWAEDYRSWLIECCDRYYVMPDPAYLAGLDMDELIAKAQRNVAADTRSA
jgi:hypothetical protein